MCLWPPAPLLLWATCPWAEVLVRGRSPWWGAFLQPFPTWGLGPASPLPSSPTGLEPAGLDWGSRSPPAVSPSHPHSRIRGRRGGVVSCLLSPCGFGCFSCCVLDSDKIKEIASTLRPGWFYPRGREWLYVKICSSVRKLFILNTLESVFIAV